MKSMILIILSLFILSATHAANETAHQHTFLVKTDLTKEQVEALLIQHHQNKNKNQAETTNLHKKSNETEEKTQLLVNETIPETTQLKAKKDKHAKKNKEAPEVVEVPEVENKTEAETVSLKKKGKKEKNKNQEVPEALEVVEVPEVENKTEAETVSLKKKGKKEKKQEVPEAPEVVEVPEVENKTETETVSLKKKGKKEKNKKQEVPETPEVKEVENKTSLLANETSTEAKGEVETETEKVALVNKDIPKQSGNKVFGFIFTILLTIAFVSLIVYATQPKKYKRQLNHNHSELTDYLLVKEN